MSDYELLQEINKLEGRVKQLEKDRELSLWMDDDDLFGMAYKITPCDFAEAVMKHMKNKAIHNEEKNENKDLQG